MFKSLQITAALTLMLAGFTGCMISPLDGQNIGSMTKKVEFSGATEDAGEYIRIQAQHPTTKVWTTIGTTYTGNVPYEAYDTDWYLFSRSLQIPNKYWKYTGKNNEFTAEVRCLTNGSSPAIGNKMLGFTTGFWVFFDPDEYAYTQEELWQFAGNGTSVTVTGIFYPI